MITRNKQSKIKKNQTSESKSPFVLLKRLNPLKSVKSERNKKLDLRECQVNLVQLNINAKKQASCPKGEEINKDGLNKRTKNQKRPQQSQENTRTLQADVTSAPVIKLRARRTVKYAESSLEISKSEEQPNKKKVPIYNQLLNNERLPKRKDDQYEFDSDSEKYKKGKKRKLNESDSDSYNETIQNILKNIARRAKLRKKAIVPPKQKVPVNDKKTKKVAVLNTKPSNNIRKLNNESNREVALVKNSLKTTAPDSTPSRIKPIADSEKNLNNNILCEVQEEVDIEPTVDDDDDEYFEPQALAKNSPSKIKILSDIHLKPTDELNLSIASPRLFKDGKPNANSTMLNRNILTPWRFNEINITRNPHFITLKQSSLPCISQEMVLNHTLIDKLNESTRAEKENLRQEESAQEVRTQEVKKTLVQPTLNDYFESQSENKENENQIKLSLFDNELLSPIKTGNRITNKSDSVRRKILAEINENVIESHSASAADNSSPEEGVQNEGDRNENVTDFGFDSDDEDNVEMAAPKEQVDRPFRVSFNVNDKKYQPKRKMTKRIEPMVVSDDEESNASDFSDTECESGEIRLFEDCCNTKSLVELQEEKIEMGKRARKRRDDRSHQKKRKAVRTKEEEEEAEKWAQAFNSMCEEIDQFPLEIE